MSSLKDVGERQLIKNIKKVLRAIEEYHPYEEPGVDVIPCKGWRSYL